VIPIAAQGRFFNPNHVCCGAAGKRRSREHGHPGSGARISLGDQVLREAQVIVAAKQGGGNNDEQDRWD